MIAWIIIYGSASVLVFVGFFFGWLWERISILAKVPVATPALGLKEFFEEFLGLQVKVAENGMYVVILPADLDLNWSDEIEKNNFLVRCHHSQNLSRLRYLFELDTVQELVINRERALVREEEEKQSPFGPTPDDCVIHSENPFSSSGQEKEGKEA